MARSALSGDEMKGHYIEVDGPTSEAEVIEVLERLIAPERVERTEHCPPVLTLRGGRAVVFVDVSAKPDGPVLLAVGDLDHDDEAREETAEFICRSLTSQTPWRLWRTADDGGDGSSGMSWAS